MTVTPTPLPETLRLSPSCIRVLGGNPGPFTLQGTNTYILGTGRGRILVDTGEGRSSWREALRSILESENATINMALITHGHLDHVGGTDHLLELCPDVKIYKWDPLPGTGQIDISDGQEFAVPGATLKALHTPGHTADHTVFVMQEEDAMFTGDNILGHGTVKFEDLASYLETLNRMRGQFAGWAYPGHGEVVEDGQTKIDEYITHRHEREDQVVAALARGGDIGQTAMELTRIIYYDVPENLHRAACGGVLQILQKLEKDGVAQRVPGSEHETRWRLSKNSSAG